MPDDAARLRISIFDAWRYLYEGDADYERAYLEKFSTSKGAVIIGAYDDAQLIGAATGAPLVDHFDKFAEPFLKAGYRAEDYFHFGGSVPLMAYRGQGIGAQARF